MRIPLAIACLFSVAIVQGETSAQEPSVHATRAEFVEALRLLDQDEVVSTHKEAILRVVGKPEQVRQYGKQGAPFWFRSKEVWSYGTNQESAFPTLGQIHFNEQGEVLEIFGGEGMPPAPDLLSEAEVQRLLRLINETPYLHNYDPRKMIKVVNTLQAMGEERAIAAILEYLRVTSQYDGFHREKVLLLHPLLYEVPEVPGYFGEPSYGAPWPPAPEVKTLLPQFPLWVYQDIPFLVVHGYEAAGSMASPEPEVERFQQKYSFRERPLRPSDDPLALVKVIKILRALNYPDEKLPHLSQQFIVARSGLVLKQLYQMIPVEGEIPPNLKLRWNREAIFYEVIK